MMFSTLNRLKIFIGFYLAALVILLLCAALTPLAISHGIAITPEFILEEDIAESVLIVFLFAVSFFVFRAFQHALNVYAQTVEDARKEKTSMMSRLSEAFTYIGSVNSEIQELHSIFCNINQYPKSKKEFKQLINHLAAKAASIAKTPWSVIRIIDRASGRTVKEHTFEFRKGTLPSATVGNRTILEGHQLGGFQTIRSYQKNTDLLTVCILPAGMLSKQDTALIAAIANQVEMYFMLYQTTTLHPKPLNFYKSEEGCYESRLSRSSHAESSRSI